MGLRERLGPVHSERKTHGAGLMSVCGKRLQYVMMERMEDLQIPSNKAVTYRRHVEVITNNKNKTACVLK